VVVVRSILVPLDGSPMAEHALIPAADIARRTGAELVLVVVHPIGPAEDAPRAGTRADEELREQEGTYLAGLRSRVAGFGASTTAVVLGGGEAVSSMVDLARSRGVDLVVGATRGRGAVARLLLGGTALRLAHQLRCPMLLLKPLRPGSRELPAAGPRRIVIPLDGSAQAETAIEAALALSAGADTSCLLVRAIGLPPHARTAAGARLAAERDLARVATRLESGGGLRVGWQVTASNNPAEAILAAATQWDADILALTTRERPEGRRALLGSVADYLVRQGTIPVLICHAAGGPGAAIDRPAAASASPALSSGES
jgi:nucleotide-binding universal stress UspA family protein